MASPNKSALPPLLFGNEQAEVHTSAQSFADMIDAMFPGVNAYEPLREAGDIFRSKSDQVRLDGVSLINTSVSPTYVDRHKNQVLTILLPISGDPACMSQVGSEQVRWGMNEGGVLLPITDERVTGTGGFRNQLMLQVDVERLKGLVQAMLGPAAPAPDLMLDRIRLLPLQYGKVSLLQGILQTIPLLRSYLGQPELLNTLGVNELLLRQVAIMLRPDLFLEGEAQNASPDLHTKTKLVRQLSEYMMAHLSDPLTLSDLENIAGVSARTLQYAFQQVHGCTPMSWLREQRLVVAQQQLLTHKDSSISQIALGCGFPNGSLFAASYRKRFGVTPSDTRR